MALGQEGQNRRATTGPPSTDIADPSESGKAPRSPVVRFAICRAHTTFVRCFYTLRGDKLSTPNHPQVPSQQPVSAPAKKRRKWPWIVGGIVVFLAIVGQCGNHDHNSSSSSSSSSKTPSTSAAAAPAPDTTTTSAGPTKPDVQQLTLNEQPGSDGADVVSATYKIAENLTAGLTKDTARMDTAKILQYVLAAYPNLTEVDVHAKADMTDMYGNSKLEEVATLTYSRATLERINWSNFNTNNMWNIPIADTADVAPALLY